MIKNYLLLTYKSVEQLSFFAKERKVACYIVLMFSSFFINAQTVLVNETAVVSNNYTVAVDGLIEIAIVGGEGAEGTNTKGGKAAKTVARFNLVSGDVIQYLVAEGGQGGTGDFAEGGGGGSTGVYINDVLVMVAGGAGGGDNSANAVGLGANSTANGDDATGTDPGIGGVNGNGGTAISTAGDGTGGAGAGINTNGASLSGSGGAKSDPNYALAAGGVGFEYTSSNGGVAGNGGRGLTGGGGASYQYSAGGGGYSGGGAAGAGGSAGGGGSYVNTLFTKYVSHTITAGEDGAATGGTQQNGTDGSVIITYFIDTDNDGVADILDLDSDNDGVLDSVECSVKTPINESLGGALASTGAGFIPRTGVVNNLVFSSSPATQNGTYTYTDVRETAVDANSIGVNFFKNGQVTGGTTSGTLGIVDIDADKVSSTTAPNSSVISNSLVITDFDTTSTTFTIEVWSETAQYTSPSDINFIMLPNTTGTLSSVTDLGSGVFQYTVTDTGSNPTDKTLNVALKLTSKSGDLLKRVRYTATNIPDTSGDRLSFSLVNVIKEKCEDTDSDGVPDYLDTDSDGDGCSDADEAYYGAVDNADADNNGTYGSGTPTVDLEGKVVGAAYSSPNAYYLDATVSTCEDNDNDGVIDAVDVDDDNDGILDTDECPGPVVYNDSFEVPDLDALGPSPVGDVTRPDSDADGEADMFLSQTSIEGWNRTDNTNSFDIAYDIYNASKGLQSIDLYGTPGATGIQKTFSGFTEGVAVDFSLDYSSVAELFEATVSVDYGSGPVLLTTLKPSTTATTASPGVVGARISTVVWVNYTASLLPTATGTVKIIIQSTSLGSGQTGVLIDNVILSQTTCPDDDGDGIPNQFDTDSDNDGCPDAIEASGTLTLDKLTILSGGSSGGSSKNLGTNVDANGSPIVSGEGASGYTQNQTTAVTDANQNTACAIDLTITKTVSKPVLKKGTNVVFTLILKNEGSQPASNVQVKDLLPTGLTFSSAITPTNTTYTPGTGIWDLSSLTIAVNQTIELKIEATVNAVGVIITNNTEIFTATETDKDSTPNSNN
ncbi:DUF11 domain-containing protein [Polaribacter sp. IC073]|uniref:DUF11 domain-containing protein n=1 Tax=Polaribacter sp. IC073 TaxID=2508540 RepID=UPI0011BEF943|nr:DUF11 domain-containing protein [Polaribacter sp. IC073]TXD50136.1 DUF11 domain-containing protein [Polaribacter sp. IC073]